MLSQVILEASPFTDAESELLQRVRHLQLKHHVSIYDLAAALGFDIHTLGTFLRRELGIDESPETITPEIRAAVFEKLRGWESDMAGQDEIIDRTLRRIATGFHTRSSLAKQLEFNYAVFGAVLHGMATDMPYLERKKIFDALPGWLESDEENDAAGIAETPTFNRCQNAYEEAFALPWPVMLTGEVGIGKTYAGRWFWRQNPKTRSRPGVVYVELRDGDTTRNAILGLIVQKLIERELIDLAKDDPWRVLKDNMEPGDLLFIDEFQWALAGGKKNDDAAKLFHTIVNELPCGLVLQGNPSANTTNWTRELDGLDSRLSKYVGLRTTGEDVAAWMEWAGYDDPALVRVLSKNAAKPGPTGGLRPLKRFFDIFEFNYPGVKPTATAFLEYARPRGLLSPSKK